jgi:hypothetical protein
MDPPSYGQVAGVAGQETSNGVQVLIPKQPRPLGQVAKHSEHLENTRLAFEPVLQGQIAPNTGSHSSCIPQR